VAGGSLAIFPKERLDLMRKVFIPATFFFLCLFGCSETSPKGTDLGGEDANKIGRVVEELNESIGVSSKIAKIFVSGSIPKDIKKMSGFCYSISGKPSVNGNTATSKVRVDNQKSGAKVAEPEWTFEKVGENWLIKSAPLS
jgi:hypothetical protein